MPQDRYWVGPSGLKRGLTGSESHSPIEGSTADSPGEAAAQPSDCWRMTPSPLDTWLTDRASDEAYEGTMDNPALR